MNTHWDVFEPSISCLKQKHLVIAKKREKQRWSLVACYSVSTWVLPVLFASFSDIVTCTSWFWQTRKNRSLLRLFNGVYIGLFHPAPCDKIPMRLVNAIPFLQVLFTLAALVATCCCFLGSTNISTIKTISATVLRTLSMDPSNQINLHRQPQKTDKKKPKIAWRHMRTKQYKHFFCWTQNSKIM